jgi:hypothetical protein
LIPFLLSKWPFEAKTRQKKAKIKTKTRESKAKLQGPKGARTGSKKANFTLLGSEN